jgi:cytochrome c oxidase subunit I+III
VATGVFLPVQPAGRRSHSWWAVLILCTVDFTVFASFAYAYIHLSMALEVCPPPGAVLPAPSRAMANVVLLAASALLLRHCTRSPLGDGPHRQRLLRACALGALVCAVGAFGLSLAGHLDAGLSPRADGWSAAVGVIVAYQGFHCVLMMVLGGFLLARSWSGHLQPRARATLDNVGLLWQAAALQGILGEAILRLVPALMG